MNLLLCLTESNQQTQNKMRNAMRNDGSGEFESGCRDAETPRDPHALCNV